MTGTSQETPHTWRGSWAIMMGYEGRRNFPTAETMYERLRSNAVPLLVDADADMKQADMKQAGTTSLFLQSGINHPRKRSRALIAGD